MSKTSSDIERINNLIKGDNDLLDEKFMQLISIDVTRVVGEYFYLNKKPIINIEKNVKGFVINISFLAENVKCFKNL